MKAFIPLLFAFVAVASANQQAMPKQDNLQPAQQQYAESRDTQGSYTTFAEPSSFQSSSFVQQPAQFNSGNKTWPSRA